MSRLASQKKLQYYPTPLDLFPVIMQRVSLDPDTVHHWPIMSILDPCAGEGIVLDRLRREFGSHIKTLTYAVEMGTERAEKVRALNFTQMVEADTVKEARFPKHAYDLLWFNPPYDTDEDAKRLEQAFFNRVVDKDRALAPGGVFIGLLPKTAMKTIWSSLRDFLKDVKVYRFPDPFYQQFHQLVIYGVMRESKRRTSDPSHLEDEILFRQIEEERIPTLYHNDEAHYILPSRNEEPALIHSLKFDPAVGYHEAAEHGWMSNKHIQEIFWPAPQPPVRTLLPLRPTFIGVMLASGLFNGLPLRLGNGELVLLKGSTAKKNVYASTREKVSKKGNVTTLDTFIEQFRPIIYVLYLFSGQLVRYELPAPKKAPDEQDTQKA